MCLVLFVYGQTIMMVHIKKYWMISFIVVDMIRLVVPAQKLIFTLGILYIKYPVWLWLVIA